MVGGLDPVCLLAALPDALAVVGPDGLVTWANERAASLLGTDVASMVGSDAFGRIHPDELGRAADGIAWAAAFPDRTAVVPYRLRRDDGSYVTVELKSTVVAGADEDHLVLVLRDGSTRTTLAHALAAVAEGRPVRETAEWLARAVAQRWPYTVAAVVHDEDGVWVVTSDDLPADLRAELVRSPRNEPSGAIAAPWDRARAEAGPIVAGLDDLPPALAALATGHGYAACAVVPVADPGGPPAVVVAWFDEPMAARLEWAHWASELAELLSLALERRAHQRALFDAARRDPLTGLANRLGFVEQASQVLDDGHDLGLVYVDLDGFKPINDAHGHLMGDQVLASIAARLAAAVPPGAFVARIGGDEFAAALAVRADDDGAALSELAERLLSVVGEPIVLGAGGASQRVTLGASAGLAVRRQTDHRRAEGTVDAALLLEEADSAMYRAKRAGRGEWRWATTGT